MQFPSDGSTGRRNGGHSPAAAASTPDTPCTPGSSAQGPQSKGNTQCP